MLKNVKDFEFFPMACNIDNERKLSRQGEGAFS